MKTLKLTTGTYMGVEVPEGYNWKIWGDGKTLSGLQKSIGSISNKKYIDLPEGSYSLPFPCVVSEMTEDMAGQVADKLKDNDGNHFYDYEQKRWLFNITATESLLSLCRANYLNPSTTILLKVNN